MLYVVGFSETRLIRSPLYTIKYDYCVLLFELRPYSILHFKEFQRTDKDIVVFVEEMMVVIVVVVITQKC